MKSNANEERIPTKMFISFRFNINGVHYENKLDLGNCRTQITYK